jgi:hypothetical protein
MNSDTVLVVVGTIVLIGIVVAILGLAGTGLFLVIRDTIRGRGKWGIVLSPPSECPECGEPLPLVRVPTSSRQAMWGGWTCTYCGCELDKYGKVISGPTHAEALDEDEPARPRRRPRER